MGQRASTPSVISDKTKALLPYILAFTKDMLNVAEGVELSQGVSTLNSTFLPGHNIGLFTKTALPKGTVVMQISPDNESKLNDAMVDLTALIKSKTAKEMYAAWIDLQKNYYDMEKAEKLVNVRMVLDGAENCFYQTIQDIPANTELLRVYGFTTWILELLELLTERNLAGYAQFIFDLQRTEVNDPYSDKIKGIAKILRNSYVKNYLDNNKNVNFEAYAKDHNSDKSIGTQLAVEFSIINYM